MGPHVRAGRGSGRPGAKPAPAAGLPGLLQDSVNDADARPWLHEAWPEPWPVIKGLAARGVEYIGAKVAQLDTATAVSLVVIGTGGYPVKRQIAGNEIYDPAKNRVTDSFPDFSPEFIKAPTLAEEDGVGVRHMPVVIGRASLS